MIVLRYDAISANSLLVPLLLFAKLCLQLSHYRYQIMNRRKWQAHMINHQNCTGYSFFRRTSRRRVSYVFFVTIIFLLHHQEASDKTVFSSHLTVSGFLWMVSNFKMFLIITPVAIYRRNVENSRLEAYLIHIFS